MAADCVDGDYLGAYSRFFTEFVARVNPNDQLPVKVSAYDVTEPELVGEIVNVTLQYLNQTSCPPSLQSYIVHLVIQAIKATCKKQPEICGLRSQEKTYAPLKLMQAVTNEVNEICRRYLDNSRLALLPPPPSVPLPQVTVGVSRNTRRKMEDRHMILHDLHTIFDIQDDTTASYYAVFDGHGGQDAAAYCATHLHQYLVENVHYPTDPERALRDAFLATDAQFTEKSNTQRLKGGTTAVCALLLNKKLYVAWVGDSIASLVKRDCVKQLVNPHRPTREDEKERICNMGGMLFHCTGVLRVNGFLSISRAIGDVPYKPYITSEPEVRFVPLDGTEDFLIIACDGLWDYVDQRIAASEVYKQVLQNPHDLKYVHQTLIQAAKQAGSLDNITVIIVFLTPPIEIASRPLNAHPLLTHPAPNDLLNNMEPFNPFMSNLNGQFDVNAAFVKQQQQQQQFEEDSQRENRTDLDTEDNRVIYGASSNGKHVEDDGNDDYDYGDLGPETDVDAVDDVPEVCQPINRLSCELFSDEKSRTDGNIEGDLTRDNANIYPYETDVDNRVRQSEDIYDVDEIPRDNARADNDARVEPVASVDDDESPPSPRAAKPLQHALIAEADNVADSEDSEDEWNYYRIDPNKGDSETTVTDGTQNVEEKNVQEKLDTAVKNNSDVQSSKTEDDIKCEKQNEDISSELIDTDISAERRLSGDSVKDHTSSLQEENSQQAADMDFQLNPDAAEFVPVSPPILSNNRRNFLQDYPISGSPLKQTLVMDDIPIPSQSEFDEEVCQRPREIDGRDFTNGDHAQCGFTADQQHDNPTGLDESEVSSTKAELDDESMARIMSATQWQTNISQWGTKIRDDTGSDAEEYNIATDPMAMSFTADDFEAVFEKGVDLNAVHDLTGVDLSDENGTFGEEDTPPRSPKLSATIEERPHTPFSDDKQIDLLQASSTPQMEGKYIRAVPPERDELQVDNISGLDMERQSSSLEQLCSPLTNDYSPENESEKEPVALTPQVDNDESKLIKDINEDTQPVVSDLLDTLNSTESFTKNSLSSTLPLTDALEYTSPQLLEGETATISTEAVESDVDTSLQHSCTEMESKKSCFEPYFTSPFLIDVANANDVPVTNIPTNSNVPIAMFNTENLTEVAAMKLEAPMNQQTQSDAELITIEASNVCTEESPEEIKTLANLDLQEANKQLLDSEPEYVASYQSSDFIEPIRLTEDKRLCEIDVEEMPSVDIDIKLDNTSALNPSDSMQEFEVVEEQLQRENQTLIENAPTETLTSIVPEQELAKEPIEIVPIDTGKLSQEEAIPESKEIAKASELHEKTAEIVKAAVGVVAGTAVATVAAKAAITATSPTKAKAATAKRSIKSTTSKSTVSTTKVSPKSMPMSPSKASSATARTSTATAQPTSAKKPIASAASRPKQHDGSTKPAVTNTVSKTTATKTTPLKTTTTTLTKSSAMRSAVGTTKVKTTAATASPKPSAEKKSVTSTDAKSLSKSSAVKPANKTMTSGATAKSALVKSTSATPRTTTSTVTSKPRPLSAAPSVKSSTVTKSTSATGVGVSSATRPKTAPVSSSTAKPRDTFKTTTKSPMIDKQIKETANKQISLGRTGASTVSRTNRASIPATTASTMITKTRTVAKSLNTSVSSPTKKVAVASKITSKVSAGTKMSASGKAKTLPNGVSDNTETTNAIITTNDKLEDDVPQKDTSPVAVPTDNQLIVTTD